MLPRLLLEKSEAASLELRGVHGNEAVGASFDFRLEAFSPNAVKSDDVLGHGATLLWESPFGTRALTGWVTRFSRQATADPLAGRHYEMRFEPLLVSLRYVRRSRIFQELTIPEIIEAVLKGAGIEGEAVSFDQSDSYVARRYLVQYQETDLNFLDRLCKESNIYYTFSSKIEDGEFKFQLVFRDRSTENKVELEPMFVSDGDGNETIACIRSLQIVGERRPGKVAVRAYLPEHPLHPPEAEVTDANAVDIEKKTAVYSPACWVADNEDGKSVAARILNRRRRRSRRLEFQTNTPLLAPGVAFTCDASGSTSRAPVDGKFLVSEVTHRWRAGSKRYRMSVAAVEESVPLVPLAESFKPLIAGVQTATVTGHDQEEIDTDDLGRVFLSFPWDQDGTKDHTSSCPVRVLQPNMPGAMLIPRIGWEVLVGFEDGDPDRPIVVGRAYNTAHTPPYELPAHKDLSVLRTFTTPGGAGMNSQHISDTKGEEHLCLNASFGAFLNVGNDAMSSVGKKEEMNCDTQECLVTVNDKASVTDAYTIQAASQTTMVGGMHQIYTAGSVDAKVGSETVTIGGALMEAIGNPIQGAIALGAQVAISLVGIGAGKLTNNMLSKFSPAGALWKLAAHKVAGKVAGAVVPVAGGFVTGAMSGGVDGGWSGMAKAGVGQLAGLLPGGDALLKAAESTAPHARDDNNPNDGKSPSLYPWEDPPAAQSAQAAGGGAGAGAGATGGPAAAGPGHKIEKVDKGGYAEVIGGSHTIITPGNIGWEVTAASAMTVGGSQSMTAREIGVTVGGYASEKSSSHTTKTKEGVSRTVKGKWTTDAGGSYHSKSGKKHFYQSKNMTIKGANMKLKGTKIVFNTGDALLVLSDKGLIYKGDITITGVIKQTKAGNQQ